MILWCIKYYILHIILYIKLLTFTEEEKQIKSIITGSSLLVKLNLYITEISSKYK